MSEEMRDLRLSSDLCLKAEQMYGHRFETLEQFLTYVLEHLIREGAVRLDQEEQRIIEERLKDLGYI